VSRDDWYRSDGWTARDQQAFEERLSRALRRSRPQYLRLKALALLETADDERRAAGEALLRRVLDEYSDDRIEVAGAHVALARLYEETGDPRRAATHYREALATQEGTNVSHGAELLLAELIVREHLDDLYGEAHELLDAVLESGPIFRVEQYRYAVARARLATRLGEANQAAAYALGALYLVAHNRPISSYHPDIGLIRADDATLSELEHIASRGDPEAATALVEQYRGPDGGVRWEWALTARLRGVPDGSWLQTQDDFHAASRPLIEELRAAGFEVYDLSEWSLRSLPSTAAVKAAVPILLRWFDETDSVEVKTAIAHALTDRRARKLATSVLLERFRRMRSPELNGGDWPTEAVGEQRRLKGRLACALGTLARDDYFDDVVDILRDPQHGRYRAYLFWALPHMKSDAAVEVALELLDDDEMHLSALRALADLRSERALPVLGDLAREPKPPGRTQEDDFARMRIEVAERGLEKLRKARAAGKSRP
jgi:hypothetical protein